MNEIRNIQAIGTSMDTSFISFNIDHPIELFRFFFSLSFSFHIKQHLIDLSNCVCRLLLTLCSNDEFHSSVSPYIHTNSYLDDIFSENDFSFSFVMHTGSFCYVYMFNLFHRQNIMCFVVILWKGKSYLRNNDISQIILQ